MKTYTVNWIVWCMFWVAFIHQNVYFGWHTHPMSDTELLADLFCIMLFASSFTRKV